MSKFKVGDEVLSTPFLSVIGLKCCLGALRGTVAQVFEREFFSVQVQLYKDLNECDWYEVVKGAGSSEKVKDNRVYCLINFHDNELELLPPLQLNTSIALINSL